MAKEWSKAFYNSKEWKECRETILKKNQYLCEKCREDGKITAAHDVHHIIHLTPSNIHDLNITLNLNNLMCLCHDCHNRIHGRIERRYKIDELGRVVI